MDEKLIISAFVVVAFVVLVFVMFRRQRKATKYSPVPDQPPIASKDPE